MRTQCPHCQFVIELADRQQGRLAQCPNCGRAFEVHPIEQARVRVEGGRRRFRLSTQTSLVILGIWVVVVAGGVLVYKMAVSSYERQKQGAIRSRAEDWKREGDLYLEKQNFSKAREAYQRALVAIGQMEVPDLILKRALESKMQTDEIKYLAVGMVKFRGRWVRLEEKENIEMTERGMIKFEGQWLPAETVEKTRQEHARAAEAEKQARLEETLKQEATDEGPRIVEEFLKVARDLAPREAADRYLQRVVADASQDLPAIVVDYTVDPETSVGSDDISVEGASRVYCELKAYITISTPEGNQRVRWFFKVRKVGENWKVTSAKRED